MRFYGLTEEQRDVIAISLDELAEAFTIAEK